MPDEETPKCCCNVSKQGEPLGYEIKDGLFFWCNDSSLTEEDILSSGSNERLPIEESRQYLKETLADGPKSAKQLLNQGNSLGLSTSTLYRAKADLKILSHKQGFQGEYVWELPSLLHSAPDNLWDNNNPKVLNNNKIVKGITPENLCDNLCENLCTKDSQPLQRYSHSHGAGVENLCGEDREDLAI